MRKCYSNITKWHPKTPKNQRISALRMSPNKIGCVISNPRIILSDRQREDYCINRPDIKKCSLENSNVNDSSTADEQPDALRKSKYTDNHIAHRQECRSNHIECWQ